MNEIKNLKYKSFVQTATYLPHFISSVIVAGIVINFLSPSTGIINVIIERLGFERIYFLIKPELFRGIFVGMEIWQEAGFKSIIFLAALAGIDQQLYEAAKIDGANRFKQMLFITIPGLLPTIMIMFIIQIGNLVTLSFEKIILLYNPSTYETADVLGTYVYRVGLVDAQYDLAAAVALFYAISKWNGFFWSMLLLRDENKVLLRKMIIEMNATSEFSDAVEMVRLGYSVETVVYATIIVSIIPMVVLYPFIQKYFTKGSMIRAVKG